MTTILMVRITDPEQAEIMYEGPVNAPTAQEALVAVREWCFGEYGSDIAYWEYLVTEMMERADGVYLWGNEVLRGHFTEEELR